MQKIKNIIFDLGGVLLDIDYQAPVLAFEQLGYQGFENMYSQTGVNDLFGKLETGNISEALFLEELQKMNAATISIEQLTRAWNAIIGEWRLQSLAYVKELKKQYHLYLLSNTNTIHYQAFHRSLERATGNSDLESYFNKAYYSHEIHLRKPDKDVYEFVLADAGMKREETLFVDDSLVNIDMSEKLRIPSHLLAKGEKIETILPGKYGL
jgi:putative hydrolase of the HAD superfamily